MTIAGTIETEVGEQARVPIDRSDIALFLEANAGLIDQAWQAVDDYEQSMDRLDTKQTLGLLDEEEVSLAGVTRYEYKKRFLQAAQVLPGAIADKFGDGAVLRMGTNLYEVYKTAVITSGHREQRADPSAIPKPLEVTAVLGDMEISSIEYQKEFWVATTEEWRVFLGDAKLHPQMS